MSLEICDHMQRRDFPFPKLWYKRGSGGRWSVVAGRVERMEETGHEIRLRQCRVKFVQMCRRGEVARVKGALAGTGVNISGAGGITGLMAAASGRQEEVVEVLLAQPGIDVTCRDSRGWRALHWACGHMTAYDCMAWHGRDTSPGRSLRSSLDLRARIVEMLLAVPGVEVGARDDLGRTRWTAVEGVEERELMEICRRG